MTGREWRSPSASEATATLNPNSHCRLQTKKSRGACRRKKILLHILCIIGSFLLPVRRWLHTQLLRTVVQQGIPTKAGAHDDTRGLWLWLRESSSQSSYKILLVAIGGRLPSNYQSEFLPTPPSHADHTRPHLAAFSKQSMHPNTPKGGGHGHGHGHGGIGCGRCIITFLLRSIRDGDAK